MIKIIKNKIRNRKAFTLVEALVAISILMIAIASPMTLAQKGLSTATLSKDQMTAAFLVQDAIESVKNIRDQAAIRGSATNDWLDTLSKCFCTDDLTCDFDSNDLIFCTIDTTSSWSESSIIGYSGITSKSNAILKINNDVSSGNFIKFDYNNNPTPIFSKFYRFINVRRTSGLNGNEAVVNVRVSWDSSQGLQKIDIQDFIYNYSENYN